MTQRRYSCGLRRGLAAITVALLMLAGSTSARADEPEVLVLVVSPKSPLRDLSLSQVRALFHDNGATLSNRRIKPINLPLRHRARTVFDDLVLNMSSSQAARYWADRQVRGRGFAPGERSSELQIQLTAYKVPTVVGYVRLSALRRGKLRVLTVDGKSHTSPDYPLKEAKKSQ